jgi:hypothetical protein
LYNFEKQQPTASPILEQEYFDNGVLMIMVKAGVELALKP